MRAIASASFSVVIKPSLPGVTGLTVDCEKLEYISSAGLRTLLFLVKRLGFGSVKMIHASDEVMDILETTGFDKKVIVE